MQNYFSFYGLNERFFLDEKDLKQRYFTISKENHPDFYIGDDAKYDAALEKTSLNNDAFKVLSKFDRRVKYILELNGILAESQNAIPQEFLMEMMDINELVMELQMDFDEAVWNEVNGAVGSMEQELNKEVEELAKQADEMEAAGKDRSGVLERIKENYLKIKYVLRIRESLNTFAAGNQEMP